jgi:hypothetical protein
MTNIEETLLSFFKFMDEMKMSKSFIKHFECELLGICY